MAYTSDIIAVKMGMPGENSFPRTAELMQGVDYLVRQAAELGRPMAVYQLWIIMALHRGDSLLETYLSNVSDAGRTVICVGTEIMEMTAFIQQESWKQVCRQKFHSVSAPGSRYLMYSCGNLTQMK